MRCSLPLIALTIARSGLTAVPVEPIVNAAFGGPDTSGAAGCLNVSATKCPATTPATVAVTHLGGVILASTERNALGRECGNQATLAQGNAPYGARSRGLTAAGALSGRAAASMRCTPSAMSPILNTTSGLTGLKRMS
jgi:hypothetical protein